MASILWIVVGTVACVWAASIVVTAALAVAAHRGDPQVVADDPWETERGERDLVRLRQAIAQARAEAAAREDGFHHWQRDRARPRPAA